MDKYSIEIKNIHKNFGNVVAVKDFSLNIKDGEFISLLGPSGCGKTTLLRILAGFEFADSGDVFMNGKNISNLPPYRRPLNMVFQRYALFPHMTVFENIAFSQFLKKKPSKEIEAKVNEMLRLVQLEGYGGRKPNQLSGGQAQRVALARSVINEPQVLLLDEPLGALDLKIRKAMQIELKNIQAKLGITFIYVTHDQEEALVMSDRIVLMNAGMIIQVDGSKNIYFHPNSTFSATFIGESNIFPGKVDSLLSDHNLVQIDGFKVKARLNSEATIGGGVFLAIRPEKVKRIKSADTTKAYDNKLIGEITEVIFFGSIVKYTVQISAGLKIFAQEVISDDQDLNNISESNIGDKITLGFSKEDLNILLK
jgi:spermidine/putrescine transport system ATP-binding protein